MKPTQHTPCHQHIKVGDLDYTAEQINQLLSLIPYKADRKEISALISFTGQNYIGHYPSATLLKPQDRFAWALVGSLSAAAPYFYYTAGNEPEGYTAGWNNMQPVFGTYDLAQEDKEDEITSEDFMRIPLHLPLLTADRAIADEHGNRIADTYETRHAVRNHIREVYNEQFNENPPLILEEYITPNMLSQDVKDMLSQAGATINNVPDGEDLTTKQGVLKLSDKTYNPGAYSGLGRVYLRKNLVGGQNLLTQAMVSKPNTIYILQYDYTLDGKSITIPEGCVLSYEGGSIRDGHINYTDTLIEGKESLNNVIETGAAIHYDNEERKLSGQGMDCIILKKTPYLTQNMVSKPNTIYIIRYNYDLNGAEITIPENCVLDFQGGSLCNGNVKGCPLNRYLKPEWFGAKGDGVSDDTKPIQQCFDLSEKVILSNKSKYKSKTLYINNNVYLEGNGATIIQSENSDLHQGLIYILKDVDFSAKNVVFDGNEPNLSSDWQALWYNFIWCAIGSMHLDSCVIGNSRGHAVRTGNIDMINMGLFNSNEFAHNVIIENCTINQSKEFGHCGDSLRIERTKNAFINNNKVYGGLSGIRSQLYCSELVFTNNVVRDSVRDVGITAAMSENIYISSNECSGHYAHGIEIDAVVDCNVSNNYLHDNRRSGIYCTCYSTGATEYIWARGVISEKYKDKGYGYQDFGSPDLPNLNTFISNNICFNNGESDALVGQDGLVYCGNYVDNPNLISDDYFFQLLISGGSINKSRCFIYDNFFKCSSKDKYAIRLDNYQFDCVGKGNKTNIEKLSLLPIIGECEIIKKGLKSLFESEIMSSYSEYVTDNKAINGKSWRLFYAYELNHSIGDVIITNGGYKIVQYKIRSTNQVDISFVVNQYNGNTWVKTITDSYITLTDDFKEFTFIIYIDDTSIGNRFILEFKVPANTEVFIEDINMYSTSISDGYSKKMQKVEYSSKGTSEERPQIPSNNIGHLYYDTTLNKPIWWTGTKWVDATGADV